MLHHGLEFPLRPRLMEHTRQLHAPEREGQLGADGFEDLEQIKREWRVMSEQHLLANSIARRKPEPSPDRGWRRARQGRAVGEADRAAIARPNSGDVDRDTNGVSPGAGHDLRAGPINIGNHATGDAARPDRDHRLDGRVPHVRPFSGGDQTLRKAAELLLAAGVHRLDAGEAGHAKHHEHEHNRRGGGQVAGVIRRARHVPPDDESRGEQRRGAEEYERARPQMPDLPGLLHGHLAHGRVQRGRPPTHVEQDPTQIGGTAHLPGSVQLNPAVDTVGRQQAQCTRSHQPHRGVAGPAAEHQASEATAKKSGCPPTG